MPTKLYLGINTRKDASVQFKTCTKFIQSEHRFEEREVLAEKNKEMIEKMTHKIKEKLLECGYHQ